MSEYVYIVLSQEQVDLLSNYDPALRKARLAEMLDTALQGGGGSIPDDSITNNKLAVG